MKIGTLIRIVASNPTQGQEGIGHLVGEEFKVKAHWKLKTDCLEQGEVRIDTEGGEIVLNKSEYELV